MIGHTGFLVTARRMAPGETAPAKKRRPAPGAYGVDYDGPRPDRAAAAGRRGAVRRLTTLFAGWVFRLRFRQVTVGTNVTDTWEVPHRIPRPPSSVEGIAPTLWR